jgi:1,5-anhydro-D-fructose reductase (1,5-anhydro-D-mannitol-forming)
LRILVIGHGLIGRQRATAAHELGGVELAGTVDPVAVPQAPVAAHYPSLDAVPDSDYDAAVIALPHHLAAATATRILASGRPVLVEKPLGLSEAEAVAVAAAAESVPLPSYVGYNYRYLATVRALFAAVAAGELGRLRSIDMLLGHGGNPNSARGWKLSPELAGGGVILDPGVHLLDLLLCLAPEVSFDWLTGTREFWGTGIEEDVAIGISGEALIGTMRVSHVRWVNAFRIEVFGDDGYALLDGRGGNYGNLTARFGRRWGWHDAPPGTAQRDTERTLDAGTADDSLARELAAVVAGWRGGAPDRGAGHPGPATLGDGVRIARLCDALYRRLGPVTV